MDHTLLVLKPAGVTCNDLGKLNPVAVELLSYLPQRISRLHRVGPRRCWLGETGVDRQVASEIGKTLIHKLDLIPNRILTLV